MGFYKSFNIFLPLNLKRGESTCQYSQEAQTQSQPINVEVAKNLLQE